MTCEAPLRAASDTEEPTRPFRGGPIVDLSMALAADGCAPSAGNRLRSTSGDDSGDEQANEHQIDETDRSSPPQQPAFSSRQSDCCAPYDDITRRDDIANGSPRSWAAAINTGGKRSTSAVEIWNCAKRILDAVADPDTNVPMVPQKRQTAASLFPSVQHFWPALQPIPNGP